MPTDSSDLKLLSAVIAATAALTVFLLTKVFELVSAYRERRRAGKAQLMAIQSELEINGAIANALLSSAQVPRTLGFRFVDDTWKTADRSILYLRHVPGSNIIRIYAAIQHFHLLVERRAAIQAQIATYPNAAQVIAIERQEMINLATFLREDITATLRIFPR